MAIDKKQFQDNKKDKRVVASYTAWGIKDTTNIPYIIKWCYEIDTVLLFHTRQDAREWIKKNNCGYVWTPIKVWVQGICKEK